MSAGKSLSAGSVASAISAASVLIIDGEADIVLSYMRNMIIGLISDTHIASPDETLPPQVRSIFDGVDLILHAGDIWVPSVLDELESMAPVMAAWGDDDIKADLGGDRRMIDGHALSFDGVTLWLTHIKPNYGSIRPREDSYFSRFAPSEPADPPDVVVFGHTHVAKIERYKDALLVNPGSATWPDYLPRLGTVALLNINSGEVEARIVPLE